jgi:cyclic pyranopterin phosphate synthase
VPANASSSRISVADGGATPAAFANDAIHSSLVTCGSLALPWSQVLDLLHRPLRDLRVSVTDRCNLRCRYCMPREVFGADFRFLPREELLSFEEITSVVRAAARHGVCKVRLTGGEPLLRRELERLVEMIAGVEGIDDIALTTNGLLLARHATRLRDAGLHRVTVSLDALDEPTLRAVADSPVAPQRVLDAIDVASGAGLAPVKVNVVVRRGLNEHCVIPLAERFRHRPEVVRFIEYMDVGSTNGWRSEDVVSGREILEAISARWPLEPLPPLAIGEVASRYRYLDGAGEIGVIQSVTRPFCGDCSRARLSADGQLFTCLFARRGHDLRSLIRSDGPEALDRRLREIWGARADRYSEQRGSRQAAENSRARIEMSYIGG